MRALKMLTILIVMITSTAVAQTQYPGTYTGTYSGDESGTWQVVISSSLGASGYVTDPYGAKYTASGSVSSTGGLVMGVVAIGASFSGQINASGHVSGTWSNPGYGMTGTFTGNLTTPPSTAPTITTSGPLPSGFVGSAYSQPLAATGGSTPYTWLISSGSLPAGLSLSSSGVISGIPVSEASTSFTARVTGSNSLSATKVFSLAVLAAESGGDNITSSLWAKAVLQVSGSPVTLKWKLVGADITPSGDQVISGYFYADPNDFAYGSVYNPEVFVKIYIAQNGWCNIAFNHVTVDNVTVFSAHHFAGAAQQTGTATLANRLVEHQYNGVAIQNIPQANGVLAPSSTDGGYTMTSGLWGKAVLQPSLGPVTLIWKEVGSDTTPSGDQVVSGYFYADPGDFAYGSEFNPEVFVKIYIATSGWCNIAFNHVTVDNVGILSAKNYAGSANQSGTASLNNRLVEHTYTNDDGGNGNAPWVGNWVQVNFLSDDDNGVWSQDDVSGIGFVARITASEWTETDNEGAGCAVTFSFSVDGNNRYSKIAKGVSKCPFPVTPLLNESGRLEFSDGNKFMMEYFDLAPGDSIVAFKWMRQ